MKPSTLQLSARLCEALRGEETEMVEVLLKRGADPNLVLPEGIAAIHLAAGMEQESGVRCLGLILQHGGDPNVRSVDGVTPLHVAASWGCYTCLKLLLMEGGDASLEDQDGNRAIDLAMEQGNEMCVRILHQFPGNSRQEQIPWISHRQTEHFPSRDTECFSETCSLLTEDESINRTLKENFEEVGPGSSAHYLVEAAPNRHPGTCTAENEACHFADCSSTSWLTEDSLSPKLNPEGSNPMGSWGSHRAPPNYAIHNECEAEDGDATVNLSQYKSFLDPDLVVKITGQEGLDVTSPDHAYLFSQLNSTAVVDLEKTVVDPAFLTRACGNPDGCPAEEKSFIESSDGGSSSSQYASCCESSLEAPCCNKVEKYEERKADFASPSSSLDSIQRNSQLSQVPHDPHSSASKCCSREHTDTPSVPVTGRDVASPTKSEGTRRLCDRSHFREAFSRICAGKSLELHNTEQSECLGNVREPSLSGMCQDDLLVKVSTENWDFCTLPLRESQCQTVPDDPGEEDTAPLEVLASVIGKQDTITRLQGGSNRASSAEAWAELNADQGRRPVSGLSGGTQNVAERGGDSWAKDTVLIQRGSEETQPLLVDESSITPTDDTAAVPLCTLKIEEDETPELDMRLRMMMLATKAHHSPLVQQDQRPCHVTPRSKSRMITSDNLTSSSASLFDETLEMPRRPRRVRSPNGVPPAADETRKQDGSLNSACRVEEETSSLEDTELITGSPRSCQRGSWQQSRPSSPTLGSLGAFTNSGRKIYMNDPGSIKKADEELGIDGCANVELKPPSVQSMSLPGEEDEDGTAQEGVDTSVEPGKSDEKHSTAKMPPRPSRVSFSRLSSRSPSGIPGRFSPLPESLSPCPKSCNWNISLSPGGRPVNLSTSEPVEYLYVDEDKGHALVERHIPNMDHSLASTTSSEDTIIYDWRAYTKSQGAGQFNKENTPPWVVQKLGCLSDEALVRKLRDFGVNPGPVTGLTRQVYMQLLEKLMNDPKSKARKGSSGYNPELSSALNTYQIPDGKDDEMTLSRQFDQPDKKRKWREGVLKSSFNYLLLDPRVTQNLPFRSQYLSQAECFRTFISAIFYVGKGKRSRPYCHLYEALTHYKESQRKQGAKACPKVQHILEIWASGEGVISMHCFQNVIPVEAYTREACMVDAIGLKMLTNQKRGDYYGIVASWPMKRRRHLGTYLLHRAMQIFLADGERQLRPTDIRMGQ